MNAADEAVTVANAPDLGPRPEWAKAVIVAQYEEDRSEIQTDSFATRKTVRIPLAWSKHTRDLFSEMRKAAALFIPTAHLGPGKGVFFVRVVFGADVTANGRAFYKGERYGCADEPRTFDTRAAAEAFVASQLDPPSVWYGETLVPFEWEIREESVEHREKWSMGAGYYLKASGRYTNGWTVSKENLR